MLKHHFAALAAAASFLAIPAVAVPAAAQEAPTHYSVSQTKVGTLIDDPAAAAILKRLIPTVWANEMFQTMGRDQTLKSIQQYEPAALSDEKLAEIQAEFDKIPAKG